MYKSSADSKEECNKTIVGMLRLEYFVLVNSQNDFILPIRGLFSHSPDA